MPVRDPFRIRKIEAWPVALPLRAPFVVATGEMHVASNVFVRVTLGGGACGYGEMAPFPEISGEDQTECLRAFPFAAQTCVGHSVTEFRKLARRLQEVFPSNPAVRCGLETALLDAFCRGMDIPLWALWGGMDVRSRETDVTLPIGPLDDVVKTARTWYDRGFRVFKMKVGQDVEEDNRRVEAVWTACPHTKFILDANQGFSLDEARECMRAMERLRLPVVLFEQPLARGNIEGLVELRQSGSIAIAADESVRSLADARELVEQKAVNVLNLKITKCGVVESVDIAGLARATGLGLMIGGMVESRVAMGCSWSLVLGLGSFDVLDLDMPLLLADDPVQGGYRYEGPCLQPWQGSGLAMEIQEGSSPATVIQ